MKRRPCPVMAPRLVIDNTASPDDDDMLDDAPEPWGPWAHDIGPAERASRFGMLAALVHILNGPDARATVLDFLAARHGDPDAAFAAWRGLRNLPTARMRRAVATYGRLEDFANAIDGGDDAA